MLSRVCVNCLSQVFLASPDALRGTPQPRPGVAGALSAAARPSSAFSSASPRESAPRPRPVALPEAIPRSLARGLPAHPAAVPKCPVTVGSLTWPGGCLPGRQTTMPGGNWAWRQRRGGALRGLGGSQAESLAYPCESAPRLPGLCVRGYPHSAAGADSKCRRHGTLAE